MFWQQSCCPLCVCEAPSRPWWNPSSRAVRSRSSQRPGGHFSADANSVQREVRSGEEPEAAAPCTAWDLHLMLEPDCPWAREVWCDSCLQGGSRQGAGAERSRAKTGHPPTGNIWLICMFTSFLWRFLPSVLQHLTFYFCIGNNWFNYRYRSNPVVAGGGRCGASERARNDTQVTCGKLVLGLSQLCKKNKDVVFTSRHSSSVVLEHGLLKISQMN